MKSPSLEKFIFEHYYGTKIDEDNTEEYKLQHPSWRKSSVRGKIDCDFKAMYGDALRC
jgi:hypothetical protein